MANRTDDRGFDQSMYQGQSRQPVPPGRAQWEDAQEIQRQQFGAYTQYGEDGRGAPQGQSYQGQSRAQQDQPDDQQSMQHDGQRNYMRQSPFSPQAYAQFGRRIAADQQQIATLIGDAWVHAIERGASMLGNNIRAVQDGTLRFMTERMEHDSHTLDQIGRSRSVLDFIAFQQDWFNAMARAYGDEWLRWSKLAANGAGRMAQHQQRALQDGQQQRPQPSVVAERGQSTANAERIQAAAERVRQGLSQDPSGRLQ